VEEERIFARLKEDMLRVPAVAWLLVSVQEGSDCPLVTHQGAHLVSQNRGASGSHHLNSCPGVPLLAKLVIGGIEDHLSLLGEDFPLGRPEGVRLVSV